MDNKAIKYKQEETLIFEHFEKFCNKEIDYYDMIKCLAEHTVPTPVFDDVVKMVNTRHRIMCLASMTREEFEEL